MPDNCLSSEDIPGTIQGGKGIPSMAYEEFETGGIALNDPSAGMLYQIWRGFIEADGIYVESSNTAKTLILAGTDFEDISITFDQNMRVVVSYIQNRIAKLYWYDATIEDYIITDIGAGNISPKVYLDDKRPMELDHSDIILAYVRGSCLYIRLQRDRYEIEYLLTDQITNELNFVTFGMTEKLRIQFNFL